MNSWRVNKPIISVLVVFLVLAVLFWLNPQWDLAISALFYHPEAGFYLKERWWAKALYGFFRYAQWLFIVPIVGVLFYGYWSKHPWVKQHQQRLGYALVVLLLGPGLIVHAVFKDQWDRARPRHIVEFGGDKIHTPAFVISDQCERNCSFVSGHAAMAFYFMIFGFVGRSGWLFLGLLIGTLGALGRVVEGGHFFSDVLFSGFFVYFTCWVLAYWMKITPVTHNSDLPAFSG